MLPADGRGAAGSRGDTTWLAATFDVPVPIDTDALKASFEEWTSRHDALSCSFSQAEESGESSALFVDVADVGMSYGAVGVLGTITAAIPHRWRKAWIGWWLAVAAGAAVVSGGYFTNAGHGVALVLGMLVATRFVEGLVSATRKLPEIGTPVGSVCSQFS